MFGAWGAGHGAACLTLLMPQRRPVSGHKKTPAGYVPAGAVVGLCEAYPAIRYPSLKLHQIKLL